MNRPAPISVFSDQRRTKSTTWSRTSCGTHTLLRAPQDFFLKRCARPSTRPGPHPWFAPSSPRTRSVSASPRPDGRAFLRLECGGSVLEELFLPAVENGRLQAQFLAEIRNWNLIQQVPSEDGDLLF